MRAPKMPFKFHGAWFDSWVYVLLNVRALEFYLTGGSALVWTLDASVWETHAGFLIFCVIVYSQYFFFILYSDFSLTRSCLANVTVTTAPISACRVLLDMSHWRPHDRQSVIKLHWPATSIKSSPVKNPVSICPAGIESQPAWFLRRCWLWSHYFLYLVWVLSCWMLDVESRARLVNKTSDDPILVSEFPYYWQLTHERTFRTIYYILQQWPAPRAPHHSQKQHWSCWRLTKACSLPFASGSRPGNRLF